MCTSACICCCPANALGSCAAAPEAPLAAACYLEKRPQWPASAPQARARHCRGFKLLLAPCCSACLRQVGIQDYQHEGRPEELSSSSFLTESECRERGDCHHRAFPCLHTLHTSPIRAGKGPNAVVVREQLPADAWCGLPLCCPVRRAHPLSAWLLSCCACCVTAAPPRASTALRPGSPPFKWPLAPVADATAPNYVAMCLVVRDQQDDIVEWVHHHLRYSMVERGSGREQGGHRVDFLLVACPGACCAKRTCLPRPPSHRAAPPAPAGWASARFTSLTTGATRRCGRCCRSTCCRCAGAGKEGAVLGKEGLLAGCWAPESQQVHARVAHGQRCGHHIVPLELCGETELTCQLPVGYYIALPAGKRARTALGSVAGTCACC